VLNRIDECASMTDLLRVYGTLCWNLSQITGRKDIPMIHLTYSTVGSRKNRSVGRPPGRLSSLPGKSTGRIEKSGASGPCHRLDNLASFVETHGERLCHFLEGMISYRKKARMFKVKSFFAGLAASLVGGVAGRLGLMGLPPFAGLDPIFRSPVPVC
jgi:EH domain-containing protein 1